MMDNKHDPLYLQVARRLIEQLKAGTSPWQKPWNDQGVPTFSMPYNQQTLQRYKGINAMNLLLSGRADPRWLTFKQAESAGFRVNRGEQGTLIQFVKTHEFRKIRDEMGRPVYDEMGKPLSERILLSRPIVSNAWVFNAEQISGLPPLSQNVKATIDWDPISRAEELIRHSGAQIEHKFIDRAYYEIRYDVITVPDRSQFSSPAGYYSTLLHELAHWTGHPSRLDRESLMQNGIEAYAKEELRAEIASMLLGDELHIGHDPSQHAAYVDSWLSILEDSPAEIHAASTDAEKIYSFLIGIELRRQKALAGQQALQNEVIKGDERPSKYLTTGDELSYKGNIYCVQGHLKQGRLRMSQHPSGLQFTLSKSDQLYHSLLGVKITQVSGLDQSAAIITGATGDLGLTSQNKR
jgi:antirestriction protein ArdC